jgi:hypothetical protein
MLLSNIAPPLEAQEFPLLIEELSRTNAFFSRRTGSENLEIRLKMWGTGGEKLPIRLKLALPPHGAGTRCLTLRGRAGLRRYRQGSWIHWILQ